jgi:hypothetical protein
MSFIFDGHLFYQSKYVPQAARTPSTSPRYTYYPGGCVGDLRYAVFLDFLVHTLFPSLE